MTYTFFCGLTTEPNDDHFLIVGYEINRGIPMGFCLPAEDRDTIQWGHIIEVNLDGPVINTGDAQFRGASLISMPTLPKRDDATKYQDAVTTFLTENGWTEETESDDLDDVMQEMREQFSIFPN